MENPNRKGSSKEAPQTSELDDHLIKEAVVVLAGDIDLCQAEICTP